MSEKEIIEAQRKIIAHQEELISYLMQMLKAQTNGLEKYTVTC